uniref:Uncharacterized protein n=1 Tax=Arundo donax TaxID=35708 RepID=A0A0A8YL25_ARUDO
MYVALGYRSCLEPSCITYPYWLSLLPIVFYFATSIGMLCTGQQ